MSETSTTTYTLQYPLTTAAGETVNTLVLKRLAVRDLKYVRKISKDPNDWDEMLLSRSVDLLPEDLEQMDLADYMVLQERFQQITGLGKKPDGDDAGAGAAGKMVSLSA